MLDRPNSAAVEANGTVNFARCRAGVTRKSHQGPAGCRRPRAGTAGGNVDEDLATGVPAGDHQLGLARNDRHQRAKREKRDCIGQTDPRRDLNHHVRSLQVHCVQSTTTVDAASWGILLRRRIYNSNYSFIYEI